MPATTAKEKFIKVLKIIFFPFLFMVNPKIYFPSDEELEQDRKRDDEQRAAKSDQST